MVWLTVCTKDRIAWLTQAPVMSALHKVWALEARAWLVGDYLLMPDHLHLFCAPADLRFTIERWIAFWKDRFSKRFPNQTWTWQRGGFHYRVRSAEDLHEKWVYMMENPVRKGLVARIEDWPWRGHVFDLHW
jgi:putative transposase